MARQSGAVLMLLMLIGPAALAESLIDPATYRGLAADQRAHRVGDSLTILIYESASATSRANTTADRTSNLEIQAADLQGEEVGVAYSANNEFQGGGVERRSGEVIARVTVTVREIHSNGELFVQGEQEIALNNESQRISVAGRLRPEDILADNSALSSRLADSKIEVKGKGMLSSRERPGILVRFFQWLL